MSDKKETLLTSFNGALPITGNVTIPDGVNINAIAAGGIDVIITSIRLKVIGGSTILKYKYKDESFDWDGKTLSAYDVLSIPENYRLYSINIDNQVQGILQSEIVLEEE